MKKFPLLIVLFALASCAGDSKPESEAPPKPEVKTKHLICPQVAIVKEAEEIIDYGQEEADPSKLVAKAKMTKIEGDCAYRKGEASDSGIDIEFRLQSIAMRGPRLEGSKAGFPFFVAVLDPGDTVINRQMLSANYRFSGEGKLAELNEAMHVFIPLPEESLIGGPDYRVLIGFASPK